ncbi:MAG: MMPL family transporter, partial [Rhodospirillales bacterium]
MQALTTTAGILVALILIVAFRSPLMLVLVGLPVGIGILVGIMVTQALFGNVHGVALTFGGVLAGVAADYPIHLAGFRRDGELPAMTSRRLSAPLMIGAGTTIAGLLALSQSSFPGLAQIGTLSATAMLAAALVSRWLLPYVTPAGTTIRMQGGAMVWQALKDRRRLRHSMRWMAGVFAVCSIAAAIISPAPVWETDLSRLSVADAETKVLDRELRESLRLPDVSQLLLVEGDDAQSVLERQTALFPQLDRAVAEGRLGGYVAAAQLLPPVAEQMARRAVMPPPDILRQRIVDAVRELPVSADTFQPFIADIARHRDMAPLMPGDIAAGPAAAFFAAPWQMDDHWAGSIMLIAPGALRTEDVSGASLVDLRMVMKSLVTNYRNEALNWLAFGALMALAVLGIGLRKPNQILHAAVPPVFAVIVTTALLIASGISLNLFHILALLLVASIGVDYALFFPGYSAIHGDGSRAFQSISLCCITTVCVFAVLSFSSIPILSAIGMTVASGSAISFVLTLCFGED